MKSSCKKFSDSISPLTIPKSNKEIRELLNCLKADIELYVFSLEKGTDTFVNHFRNSVLPIIERKGLFDSFENQLTKYVRVLVAKTVSIFHNYQTSMKKLLDDMKQINTIIKYSNVHGIRDKHIFVESIKIAYVDFSNLSMIASQTLFALEFYCKILCALGCAKFALRVARAEAIQHNTCWKQLKRFSNKNCTYCETCVVSDTCKSNIDFEALSRIYAYSMKIRQIADYTPKFASFDIRCLIEHNYFGYLEFLLRENTLFYKCLIDVMPNIWHVRKELVNELKTPFIWSDEEGLKDALRKNQNSDFYNYLLGRFYYQRKLYDDAIKPLERAKKINPRNADVWYLLADIYSEKARTKADLEKALEHLRKARDLEPTSHEILWGLGVLELGFGNCSSSIDNLTKASENATTDFDKCVTFATLSEAYRIKGMMGKSEHYLKKSKRISELYAKATLETLREFIDTIRAKLQ
jgi:tetratricopeptide (TPR) repeat protein